MGYEPLTVNMMNGNRKITNTVFLVLILFIMSACQSNNPKVDAIDMINKYLYDRYDALSSEVFYSRTEFLNTYYSDELLNSASWLTNKEYHEATYNTLNKYNIKTSILEFSIEPEEEGEYIVELFVLYTPEDEMNQYYIAYRMMIYTTAPKGEVKINAIDLLEHIPVFTGGQEIILDHDLFHEHEHLASSD